MPAPGCSPTWKSLAHDTNIPPPETSLQSLQLPSRQRPGRQGLGWVVTGVLVELRLGFSYQSRNPPHPTGQKSSKLNIFLKKQTKKQVPGCVNFSAKSLKSRLRTLDANQRPKEPAGCLERGERRGDSLKCSVSCFVSAGVNRPALLPAQRRGSGCLS